MSLNDEMYLENQYLKEFDTKVLACKMNDSGKYEIILEKTIFYPHLSGGQPRDYGFINGLKVENVYEDKGKIVHIIDNELRGDVHLEIDFDRRFDHMQQHTGQHILSGAFFRLYGAKTIGFHLGEKYITVDIDLSNVTEEMIKNVEKESNSVIYNNIKVETRILDRQGAIDFGVRKVPDNENEIRVIKISEKDCVGCCGTHVANTGEIGIVKIVKWEKYKNGTRIEFVCGNRALYDFINKNSIINKLGNEFSCSTDDLLVNINKYRDSYKENQKKISSLQEQLNLYLSKDLINTAILNNNINYIVNIFDGVSMKDIRHIATTIVENEGFICGFLLKNDQEIGILLAKSKDVDTDIKSIYSKCANHINAKGGGNDRIIQGSSIEMDKIDECYYMLNNIFFG